MYVEGLDLSEHVFNFNAKSELIAGGDPLDALCLMSNADFLIMSKSSLSFTGAVLNSKGKIFYPVGFWHPALNKWRVCH